MALTALVFVCFLVIVGGAHWIFVVRPEHQEQRRVRRRLKRTGVGIVTQTVVESDRPVSTLAPLAYVLKYWSGVIEPLQALIDRAGATYTVGALVMACAFLAVIGGTVAWRLTSLLPVALIVAAGSAFLPIVYVRRAARKRLSTFEEQFPEGIDLIARALRAGHTLPTALELAGDEIPAPVGAEFKRLFDQQNFGLSLPDALRAFAARVPLLDARFFVTAVLTQREMGGNLSEVLDKLAAVIRERFKVKRHVRAVSAHGRITGWVLGALPPIVAGVLYTINPELMRLMVDDPIGVAMVATAITLQVIGVLIIRRIVAVEY